MKKILSALLSFSMLISITTGVGFTVYANELTSGQCGANAYYDFDNTTGILTISGTGYIYDSPFSGNRNIKTVIINEGIKSIGYVTFKNCSNLNSITIPKTVTAIYGEDTFYSCNRLNKVYYNGTLSEWALISFDYCDNEDGTYTSNPLIVAHNLYIDNELVTKGIIENISEIKAIAFKGLTSLEEITISSSVKTIGKAAFSGCLNLKKTNFLGSLDDWVQIDFGEWIYGEKGANPTRYSKNLFLNGNLLQNAIINSAKTINPYAFVNCQSIEGIEISDSVSEFGAECFLGCSNLKKVNFLGTVDEWANINFYGNDDDNCYSANPIKYSKNLYISNALLTELDLKDVENINSYAFYNCESLNKLQASIKLKNIGYRSFYGCRNLKELTIPSNVEFSYEYAPFSFNFIKSITICDGSTELNNNFNYLIRKTMVNELVLPNSITYIPDSAFMDCVNLTKITIPRSVTRLEFNAFSGCTNITIKGYKNSYAETYSTLVGIPFETIDSGDNNPSHIHSFTTKTTKATVDKNGSVITSCDVCGYVQSNTTVYSPKSVVLSTNAYTYNDKAKKPSVTVKDSKGTVISSNNYTVTYANNKNVGKATVKITFKGNYSGAINKTFTINPKPTSITSAKAKSKGFTVKWSKITAQADGYQIQYATKNSFKSAKSVTVKGSKNKAKSVSNLKSKKKYYIRIRTYKTVSGKKYYSSWSKAKTITTKK